MKNPSPYWVSTATGVAFDYDNPQPHMIDAEAIGWHLSMESRWYGNLNFAYSVAQHSKLVAEAIPRPEWRAHGLLHDAAEMVMRDLPDPFKQWLQMQGADVIGLERRILAAVFERFALPPLTKPIADAIDLADMRARATEYRDVVRGKPEGWQPTSAAPLSIRIRFKTQTQAYDEFMDALGNNLQLAHAAGVRRVA